MSTATFGSAIKWNFIGSVVRAVATFGCQVLLLRILGPSAAGRFAIFMVTVGLGSVLSEGGMMVALTRAPSLDRRTLANAAFLILCYAGVMTAALVGANGPIAGLFRLVPDEAYIPLLAAANVLPLALTSIPLSVLRRQYRTGLVQSIQTGGYLFGFLGVGVPAAFWWHSADALMFAFTTQSVVTLIAAWLLARCPLLPRVAGARTLWGVSARGLLVNIVYFFNESAPNVLTAHYVGTRSVGLYGTASNLLRTPTDLIISSLHGPLLVSTAADDDGQKTRDRFLSALDAAATLVLPGLLIVFLCAGRIVVPLLGPKWIDASPVLTVMGLVMAMRLFSMLSGAVLWGNGQLLVDFSAQCATLATFVGLFLLFQPRSAEMVAWLLLVALTLRWAGQTLAVTRRCGIGLASILRALVLPALVSAILMLPLYPISRYLLGAQNLPNLVLLGLCALPLLAVRIVIALWWSPYAWASLVVRRLPGPLSRRPDRREAAIPLHESVIAESSVAVGSGQ